MERQFDVCHTCRRCFNLCDSFPRLFDLIDESKTGELDSVPKSDYAKVDEACTLCDMCFLTKCPYVPPHPFDVDIPHLILRYRAARRRAGHSEFVREQLGETDRNGRLAKHVAGLANWGTARKNTPLRKLMEAIAQIDAEAELPKYHSKTAEDRLKTPPAPNPEGPAFGKRKVALYATCYVDFNKPDTAVAAARVLAHQGCEVKLVYPECCRMPQLEAGDLKTVADSASRVAKAFAPYIEDGYDIVALTASCGLMMKFEWPLISPDNPEIVALSARTKDVCEYVVELSRTFGLASGLTPVEGGVTLHHACHARAQNMGAKSADLLKLIPDTRVEVVERCSGHGGTFGVMKATHEVANKVGRPAARQVAQKETAVLCSDCPLACKHLGQLIDDDPKIETATPREAHPIEIFAQAYGF
ncbi:MAG: glycerol-3-phosphate dehydrogenase [Proteobacteria bacterium]|nr:glycerol-3-phosphate dehydrogenase [Pseudomonadota bacterium]